MTGLIGCEGTGELLKSSSFVSKMQKLESGEMDGVGSRLAASRQGLNSLTASSPSSLRRVDNQSFPPPRSGA